MPIYAKSSKNGEEKERLAEHTIKDMYAGRQLVENLPFGSPKKKRIRTDLDLCTAFHDVGKAATGFQDSLEDGAQYWGRRHEILSAVAATSAGLKESIIFAILTHHKTLPSDGVTIIGCLPDEQLPYRDHMYPVWEEMARQWDQNIIPLTEEWEKICKAIRREDLLTRPLNLTAPLSDNMRNWLKRDKQPEYFPFKERYYTSLLRGLMISSDHIMSAGNFMPVNIPRLNQYNITSHHLYGFQTRASKKKGNLILRAPTGSGKTEAALLWARLNQKYNGRLFYALPTTASLNAMYPRLKESFQDVDNRIVGLLHSRTVGSLYSMFEQDNDSISITNQATARALGSLVREMYFPVRICTPHQILRYSLQGKGWESMLSEFPNSVFVFDEIHAYNAKVTGLTIATVKFLLDKNATCMFLSATLPKFIRKLIEHEIPSIGFMQPSYRNHTDRRILEQKRHILETVDGDILSNIDLIAKAEEKAQSILVVCNHVPTAQDVYRELVKKVKDTVLLHSQFTRRDRNEIENDLLRSKLPQEHRLYKKLPKILVSTQVVEVSLDLDFQLGFTEPAPIDAIVQRLGRINRYALRLPTQVSIFGKQAHSYNIYDKDLTAKSLRVLSVLPKPLGEEDLNHAADRVYGKGYSLDNQEDYEEGLNYSPIKKFKKYLLAGTNQNWIEEVIDEKEGSLDILPEPLVNEYNKRRNEGLKIEASNLLVPIGKWRGDYLFSDKRIDTSQDPWVLLDCKYSKEIGLEI